MYMQFDMILYKNILTYRLSIIHACMHAHEDDYIPICYFHGRG